MPAAALSLGFLEVLQFRLTLKTSTSAARLLQQLGDLLLNAVGLGQRRDAGLAEYLELR